MKGVLVNSASPDEVIPSGFCPSLGLPFLTHVTSEQAALLSVGCIIPVRFKLCLCLDSSNIKSYVKMYDVLQTLCITKLSYSLL